MMGKNLNSKFKPNYGYNLRGAQRFGHVYFKGLKILVKGRKLKRFVKDSYKIKIQEVSEILPT